MDPMTMMALASAAKGLIGGITGIIQKHKANKLLRDNPYPTYTVPNEILQNQKTAQIMANTGLPSEQYNLAKQNIARNLNFGISKSNDRAGGLMTISALTQNANDATANLDASNAAARLGNKRYAVSVNNTAAGYKDKAWDWNIKNKYNQMYDYAMGLKGEGNQNLSSGIDNAVAAGVYGAAKASGNTGRENNSIPDLNGSNVPSSYSDYLRFKRMNG